MTILQPSDLDPESSAQRLVGMFLQKFALMEQALDLGIGKLLGVEGAVNDLVCSSIPIAKKIKIFSSAECLLSAKPDSDRTKELDKVWSNVTKLNGIRVIFAHNPFYAIEGGVYFRRVVVDKEFKVSVEKFPDERVATLCDTASKLIAQLDNLVEQMVPFKNSLDFSDPRNSSYIIALL